MEVKTINPVLIDPEDPNINGYVGDNVINLDLSGQTQDVNLGDFVVKGTNPVFIGDQEASVNEFLYSEPVELDGETLTPNDEFLYSNEDFMYSNIGGGKERRAQRRLNRKARRKAAREKANTTSPGNGEPSAAEQDAKAKEGKFWDVLKNGWSNFTTSPSGQIILDSATNYLSNKLGGTSFTQSEGDFVAPPADDQTKSKPMSQTMKIALIGGGVLVVGVILYYVLRKK